MENGKVPVVRAAETAGGYAKPPNLKLYLPPKTTRANLLHWRTSLLDSGCVHFEPVHFLWHLFIVITFLVALYNATDVPRTIS